VLDPAEALHTYVSVFTNVAIWGAAIGIGVLIISPLLGRLDRPAVQPEAKPAPAE
jgi:hypothetical protein